MDLLNLSVFSAADSPSGTTDTVSFVGEKVDLNQEFSQMLHVLRQSKLSNSTETEIVSGGSMAYDGEVVEDDGQPLKNLINFMDAVESQLEYGNGKTANALPVPEVVDAFSDLLGFLKALRQHLSGGEDSDISKTINNNDKSDQFIGQTFVTDLVEFEQVLNDLSVLIVNNGSVEKALCNPEFEKTNFLIEQTVGNLVTDKANTSAQRIQPSENLSSNTSNATPIPVSYEMLQSETRQGDKLENVPLAQDNPDSKDDLATFAQTIPQHETLNSMTSNALTALDRAEAFQSDTKKGVKPENGPISRGMPVSDNLLSANNQGTEAESGQIPLDVPVYKNEVSPDTDPEHASADQKSSGEPVLTVNLPRPEANMMVKSSSADAHKLFQDVDVSREHNLEEALAPLRELVAKLRTKNSGHSLSLTQTEQSKLVKAIQTLRSINFADMSSFVNFETHESGNFISEPDVASVASAATVADPLDLKTLETLAQSVLAENQKHTPQLELKMTRTDFAAFPPKLPEKAPRFDGLIQDISEGSGQISPLLQSPRVDAEYIPVGIPRTEQISEKEHVADLNQDTNRVLLQLGDMKSVVDDEPKTSVNLEPEEQLLRPDMTRPSMSHLERYEKSTSKVSLPESIAHDVDAPVEIDSKQIKSTEFIDERTEASNKAMQSGLQPIEGRSDRLISEATVSAFQNGERPQDNSVHGAQPARSLNGPLRYERPVMHKGTVDLENTEVKKASAETKGKAIGLKSTVHSTLQKGEQVEVKLQSMSKPQNDAQTPYLEVASSKTLLRGTESMKYPEEGKVEKMVTEPTKAVKEVATKKITVKKNPQSLEIEKHHFELPFPRLKRTPIYKDSPSKPETVTDFSVRAADALMLATQSQTRKKNSGSVSSGPFAAMNLEAGMLQQTYSVIANNNSGAQTQSGSERLEKWIDTQLDLTSRGWVNNLSKTIVSAINRGQQRLMLALSPPSLGRINIVFSAKATGLDLRIHAERKATLALLGDAETKLISNMENAGHKVNNLSYADMSSTENKFDSAYNQSADGGKDDADKRDPSEHENAGDVVQVAQDKTVAKNIDDASLVNITV